MRIVQVIHNFLPAPLRGSELFTLHLCRELEKRHDVSVFHRIADPRQAEYGTEQNRVEGLDVCTVNQTFRRIRNFRMSYDDPHVNRAFERYLRETKPQIVHFQHVIWMSMRMVPIAKSVGARVLYTLHDYYLICQAGQLVHRHGHVCDGARQRNCVRCRSPFGIGWRNLLARAVDRVSQAPASDLASSGSPGGWSDQLSSAWSLARYAVSASFGPSRRPVQDRWELVEQIFDRVDLFLSPSRYVRQRHVEAGLPPDKVVVSPYGFPLHVGSDRGQRTTRAKRPIRFAYIGSMIPTKGVHTLIEAFTLAVPSGPGPPRALLKLYGVSEHEVAYARVLRNKAAHHPGITFEGEFPHHDVQEIFGAFDVLVVPSLWLENAPLVIHEGFQFGVPSICARVGGMPELIEHGRNGLLFEPGDVGDLARCISKILEDRNLIDEFRENLPAVRSIADCAAEHERIYERLLGSPSD